jgi:hypothetical protein
MEDKTSSTLTISLSAEEKNKEIEAIKGKVRNYFSSFEELKNI